MGVELGLAAFENLRTFMEIIAILLAISAAVACIGSAMASDFGPKSFPEYLKQSQFSKIIALGLICGLFSCLPSVKDLWQVRISLIKYRLASPENLKAGTEAIERIAAKLECKYLGCAAEKKKSD